MIRKPRGNGAGGRGQASIQDVAEEANVSIATVSRVLNNPAVVSPATAEKVREVIKRLGYVPNPFAQGLITRASRVLCFALPDIHGEFYSELIRGADAEAHRLGYHLLVSSEARSAPDATWPDQSAGLALGLVDGLAIMITEPGAMSLLDSVDEDLPVVLIDVELSRPGRDCVLVDNATGAAEATRHLLAGTAGDRVYFVGGAKENFDTRARSEAFLATLRGAGVSVRPDQTAFGRYEVEWGREWYMGWLSSATALQAKGPIGVLAGNDEIALGVLQAAEDAGVPVPGMLRVVGFDDTRLASIVRPKLSSVRVPLAEVGGAAIRALAARIEDPEKQPAVTRLQTALVVRESSRAPGE
ncbi:MAG: LacI family DNA-binding transcriptional regulator [Phycisphaeraceae bacterium]|nr:LacI family DNA-binding transcriptional regulator [Phycisphaeraceae bacterium]MBX3410147.1 LacI family DNA-binding transcriptional regulator [Phycisphaeraceae bacterium]